MDYNITFREKNKSLQCIISYKDSNEKWKQVSKQGYKTQKEAKPWIDETVKELEKTVNYIDSSHAADTFGTVISAYIEHSELYNQPNTVLTYSRAKTNFKSLLEMKISKITSINIQKCIDDMVKQGLKATTVKSHLVKLNTIFKYAIKNRIIKDNPIFDITIPADKSKKDVKIKALSKAEIDDLLNKIIIPRHYYMSLIAVTCGVRLGELLALKWSDINEKDLTLIINKQWKLMKREPETYGEGIVKRPNSNRIVPIPAATMDKLKKYKSSYPIAISGRLFPYKSSNSASVNLRVHYKKIGYDISIHDLRHTYVSLLVAKGLDFQTIASLIGDTVAITIKTYSHFTSDMMTKAKNAVENII